MPAPPVILNNTPLVALQTIEQLDLLPRLFDVVWIPAAVEAEFLAAETAVAPLINRLLENGLYLSSDVVSQTLVLAQE